MTARRIRDPEVQLLASIAHGLHDEYTDVESDPWSESPFGWIKERPSRQRGKIGEQLLAGWCAARDQSYDLLVCLGLQPFDAHCWVIPKSLLYEHVIGHTPQHTGRGGTDTFWLSFSVSSPPSWLKGCGGTLRDARGLLAGH